MQCAVRCTVFYENLLELSGDFTSGISGRTRGCPKGDTVGPWSEWQDTMYASAGRCFSKAILSGALTEVCPATMAPTFVAVVTFVRIGG